MTNQPDKNEPVYTHRRVDDAHGSIRTHQRETATAGPASGESIVRPKLFMDGSISMADIPAEVTAAREAYDALEIENADLRQQLASAEEEAQFHHGRFEAVCKERDDLRQQVERITAENARHKKWHPIHGPCCTCQGCGREFNECRCDLNEALANVERLTAERDRARESELKWLQAYQIRVRELENKLRYEAALTLAAKQGIVPGGKK